ncbi:CoA-acylating methylmalonate-semialdehyde dehydrogenase [Treponema sp. OMZ 840]|uniref:CoA-acylating methylmalonate-semialdehyde dehydrogenase n=1 Tax=Treponema sp. OMZ 840 TaxID=244313 RepID=UPI003D92C60B
MKELQTVKPFINGTFIDSKTDKYNDQYNPSTGEIISRIPQCTKEEIEMAISAAHAAYKGWSATPVLKRTQILYKLRDLIIQNMEELTHLVALENGKNWFEAEGDVLKAKEGTEQAIAAPSLMMGESLMDTSSGFDTVSYRQPLGVFAGISPFNFPSMIPMGWMTPICIACGNTIVIKASSTTPLSALRFAELYKEAGLPDGVLNIVTCSRTEAEILLTDARIKGISFVGTTDVGKHVYSVAAQAGKRVQVQGEAKNHALIMDDVPVKRTAAAIINAAYGCAGERCMALPVIVVHNAVADALVSELVELAKNLKIGPGYDKSTDMGPVISAKHRQSIIDWINKGIQEGAKLVLDGRECYPKGFENGFYLGPTILDYVSSEMTVGQSEIFGPVLCIKRVNSFEEGLQVMNGNRFANGSAIFTQSGYYAREFARHTDGGMVGVNVAIPVPVGMFPFSGHKDSFIGDLHCLGKDGYKFFTETKTVTSRWFDDIERKVTKVSTWDGTI